MRKICISNAGTHGHTHQFSQSGQSRSRCWPITQCPIARTWESAPKQWAVMAIVEGRSPTFETVLRRLIGCIYFFKCGIKTKTHFEWLLWHWSSLGQLNLERTRPNGLVGCKVPTDLVKISVKEATHMGFHYITSQKMRSWKLCWLIMHYLCSVATSALIPKRKTRILLQNSEQCTENVVITHWGSVTAICIMDMMTSSNGNIFRVTGHLCGKFTGPRWISRTKASDAELWCFLWFTPD